MSQGTQSMTVGRPLAAITVTASGNAVSTSNAAAVSPFTGVAIGEPNVDQSETATVTLNKAAAGALSDPSAKSNGSTLVNGVYSVSGSAAAVAAALGGLMFTPASGQTLGTSVVTTVTATVADSAGESATLSSVVTATAPAVPATVTLGSGSDVLALEISEDAYQGNAQFTIEVDGQQVGGVQTAQAIHSAGQDQTVDVMGSFAPGNHTVSVNFLNDAYGGSSSTDRNLYVSNASIDGSAINGSALTLLNTGSQSFTFSNAAPAAPDTLDLHMSEDAWQGDAEFTISINGTTIGGVHTATASHAAGATQDVAVSGNWGANPTIGISFINDAYGGTPATDRNLYIDGATYDGQALNNAPATLLSNGTTTLTEPSGAAQLSLGLAEDAYNGDAQYSVAVDGKTLVQDGTVTALHAQGASQTVDLQDMLSPGVHDVAVSFLNDAYGGSPTTDRNLYVTGLDVNGTVVSGATATLYSNGAQHFQIVVPV